MPLLTYKLMDVAIQRKGSPVSKNREDGPKMGHEIKSTPGLSAR